jgi:hypothetical protein
MPARVRPPSVALDHASMTAADLQAAYDLFRKAETAGALVVRYEKVGLAQKRPSKAVLVDRDKLALFLGRERAAKTAALTKEIILKELPDLPDAFKPTIALIETAWARSKVRRRLEPGDAAGATQSGCARKPLPPIRESYSIDDLKRLSVNRHQSQPTPTVRRRKTSKVCPRERISQRTWPPSSAWRLRIDPGWMPCMPCSTQPMQPARWPRTSWG